MYLASLLRAWWWRWNSATLSRTVFLPASTSSGLLKELLLELKPDEGVSVLSSLSRLSILARGEDGGKLSALLSLDPLDCASPKK